MANSATSRQSLVAPWRIGVDVGGTFTDMVLRDSAGAVCIFKAPSVPADPSEGVLGVLRLAAQQLDLPLSALLRDCALFVHGSTVATNTILEKKGAKVGMLTTEGFRDSLEIRRGIRDNQWDHRAPFPPVLVPRYLRLPVRGRIGADGSELAPLVAEDVDAALDGFEREGVESVAVCLFNSFLDGAHEQRGAARSSGSGWQRPWVSLSSEVMPTMGEYERGSTAVVNAYIAPKVSSAISRRSTSSCASSACRARCCCCRATAARSRSSRSAAAPVMLVLSGPAAGVGALNTAASRAGSSAANLISMEIGGTSCDVMVMARGEVPVADELMIDGYHLTDAVGRDPHRRRGRRHHRLGRRRGPAACRPAGRRRAARPAAYGLGGEQPTVTDAQLVLGRLRPGPLAGGAVTLDRRRWRARPSRQRVARPLGLSVEDAAAGVIRLLEQNLLHAVERLSIERGHNPATFTLVAAGGAGPMHGAGVARALGCMRALLPRAAGAFWRHRHAAVRRAAGLSAGASWPISTRSTARALDAGFASSRARARAPCAREGFRPSIGRARARDRPALRRPAMAGARAAAAGTGFDAAAARRGFRSRASAPVRPHPARRPHRHHRAARRRPRPPRLDAAGRASARRPRRPSRARRARSGSIRARLARDVPIYDGADLRPGLHARRPAADRGAHHHRLRRPARPARGRCDGQLHDRGGGHDADSADAVRHGTPRPRPRHETRRRPSIPSPWRWCRTGSTTSRTRWAG